MEEIVRKLPALLLLAALCLAQSGTRNGIDRSMFDTTCKPCDDFLALCDGNLARPAPLFRLTARAGVSFEKLSEANLERLKTILDTTGGRSLGDRRPPPRGRYYASCMDTASIEWPARSPYNRC